MISLTALVILIWASLIGCSVLIIKNSHGNVIKDNTTPETVTNTPIQFMGRENKLQEKNVTDSLKVKQDGRTK